MKSVGLVAPLLAATAMASFIERRGGGGGGGGGWPYEDPMTTTTTRSTSTVNVDATGRVCPAPATTTTVQLQPVYYSEYFPYTTVSITILTLKQSLTQESR